MLDVIYDLRPRLRALGFADKGVSTYYSHDVSQAEAALAHKYLASRGLSQAYNSRLFASAAGGARLLTLRLASASAAGDTPEARADAACCAVVDAGAVAFEGSRVAVTRGDHAPLMARVCAALEAAVPHAASPTQAAMLAKYVTSFRTGSQTAHVEGSELWVKDKGPVSAAAPPFPHHTTPLRPHRAPILCPPPRAAP